MGVTGRWGTSLGYYTKCNAPWIKSWNRKQSEGWRCSWKNLKPLRAAMRFLITSVHRLKTKLINYTNQHSLALKHASRNLINKGNKKMYSSWYMIQVKNVRQLLTWPVSSPCRPHITSSKSQRERSSWVVTELRNLKRLVLPKYAQVWGFSVCMTKRIMNTSSKWNISLLDPFYIRAVAQCSQAPVRTWPNP